MITHLVFITYLIKLNTLTLKFNAHYIFIAMKHFFANLNNVQQDVSITPTTARVKNQK
jgi:hypothetical protein